MAKGPFINHIIMHFGWLGLNISSKQFTMHTQRKYFNRLELILPVYLISNILLLPSIEPYGLIAVI